jgi:hypothetical protein
MSAPPAFSDIAKAANDVCPLVLSDPGFFLSGASIEDQEKRQLGKVLIAGLLLYRI